MRDFTQGHIVRHIIAFALPMLVGNIFQQLYNLVDAWVAGQFVSSDALAAVGTSTPIINFITPLLIGVTNGAAVLISQFFGAKRMEELQRTVSTSIIALGIAIATLTAIGLLATPWFLDMLNTPADIFADAALYLRISFLGLFFMMFYNLYTAFLRALGNSKLPLYVLIASSLLNLVLDLLFVIGFSWGVAGVAVATLISQALATLLCFLYPQRRIPAFRVRELIFDRQLFRFILQYGLPNAIQLSLSSFMNLTVQNLVNGFGSAAIAGITAANRVDSFAYMPITNVSNALSTMVAQNMGAGEEKRAKSIFYQTTVIMLLLTLLLTGLIWSFGQSFVAFFFSADDPNGLAAQQIGTENLVITSAFYLLFSLFFALSSFFRGVGDSIFVMFLSVVSIAVRAVAAYLLVRRFAMGPEAIAWSFVFGWGFSVLLGLAYYLSKRWQGKVVGLKAD